MLWISYNTMVLTLLFNQIQQLPSHLRSQAADTLYFEAQYRLQDPVYGCVAHIFALQQQVIFNISSSSSFFIFYFLIQ